MKLKLDFVNKVPKLAKDNEVILIKDKIIKSFKLSALEDIKQGSLYRRTIDSFLMDL